MEGLKAKLGDLVSKYSPGKRKKAKRNIEVEMEEAAEDATFDQDEQSGLTFADKKFMMDMMLATSEEIQKTLNPMAAKITALEEKSNQLEATVTSLAKGVPAVDLANLKTELQDGLSKEIASKAPDLPPGLVGSQSSTASDTSSMIDQSEVLYVLGSLGRDLEQPECLARGKQALLRAGCDEPYDIFAQFGYGSQCWLKYQTTAQANKAKALLKVAPTRFPDEEYSVWLDVKQSKQKRQPKIAIKELEKALNELSHMETLNWKVVRCVATRQIYINKQSTVKMSADFSLVWQEGSVVPAHNRQELQDRIRAVTSR